MSDDLEGENEAAPKKRRNRPSPRKRGIPRKRTVATKRLTREFLRVEWLKIGAKKKVDDDSDLFAERPKTWGDCRDYHAKNGERPCPWVACSHHLYLDVNPETGSITINFPDLEPWELKATCSLDLAERGGITLEEIGDYMNITRERVRQIEVRALMNVKPVARRGSLHEHEIGSSSRLTPLAEIAEEAGAVESVPSMFSARASY